MHWQKLRHWDLMWAEMPAILIKMVCGPVLQFWEVSENVITTFLAANPYNQANWKNIISSQKWVALFNQDAGMVRAHKARFQKIEW